MTALPAFCIIIGIVYVGNPWSLGAALLVGSVAGWEFCHMMEAGGYHPNQNFTLGLIILLVLDGYFWPNSHALQIITFMLIVSLGGQLFSKKSNSPTADWALSIVGGLYIGWGLAYLVGLRQLANGQGWVWLALLPTWSADTFAYLIGRRFGRHKLWPRHSPGKTWEGFFGGILGGLLAAIIIKIIFAIPNWGNTFLLGLLIPLVAFFGDISESMMKRDMGVKDASNLFPGHGGFLDRIDSLMFVSVLVYYYARWVG